MHQRERLYSPTDKLSMFTSYAALTLARATAISACSYEIRGKYSPLNTGVVKFNTSINSLASASVFSLCFLMIQTSARVVQQFIISLKILDTVYIVNGTCSRRTVTF